MKKLIYTLLFVLISVAANGQQAKYVFYFIGDGMGVNQVNGTEMYQAELQNGRIGVEPLLFTQFPVATMATTFSDKLCYRLCRCGYCTGYRKEDLQQCHLCRRRQKPD